LNVLGSSNDTLYNKNEEKKWINYENK